ncbi:D-alanyl-D-alanine carboxypeptidase [hydrothermal vent metagenome]|uniref:D-alanyl-D-alanine carboxypeptidase n=1 Tax=hydrothermal vent metagenome TaxID=652676 RepID=A0A3B1DP59_9ZZZZ
MKIGTATIFKNHFFIKIVAVPIFIFLVFPSLPVEAKKRSKKRSVSCKSVIFSNSTKVKRLYGKGVHNRVLPASTTKVMTALLVLEKLPLDKYITVGKRPTYAQPTKIYVKPGEQYKVRDLLYAILLKSANDASIVLAEAVAGSEANFIKLMNKRAKQIGAKHTKFANSNGLPNKHVSQYTTAYDMYLIFRQALKHSFFKKAIKYKHLTIKSKTGRKIALKSHNKILFKGWGRKIYGKTGYTRAAKACFIGTLEKGRDTLIVGVFGCTNRWGDIKHVVSRYGKIPL